jgi:hypothetical protein
MSKSANAISMRSFVLGEPAMESQLKDIYLEMEQRWLLLARSHEFSQRLDDLSNETKRRADELPKDA